jgi:hypothetical protein
VFNISCDLSSTPAACAEVMAKVSNGEITQANPFVLFAIAFALLVVSYVIQSVMMKARPEVKPAAIEEWEFPQSEDGTPQAIIFGDSWATGPMVIWYGNYRTFKIKSKGK